MANKKRTSPITPAQIKEARGGMSQSAAASVAGYSLRQWQNFEAGEVAMSSAAFNEFCRVKNTNCITQ